MCVTPGLLNANTHRGKDFCTSFGRIGGLQALTRAPVIGLTASVPPAVEEQLLKSLSMHSPTFIKHILDRPNIFYTVLKKSITVSGIISMFESLVYTLCA